MSTFNPGELLATGGCLYGHLCENPRTGLARGLYWSLTLDCAPVVIDGMSCDLSMACEWLVWPVRRWPGLHGATLDSVTRPELVESSFYLGDHHSGTATMVSLQRQEAGHFDAELSLLADVTLPDGTLVPNATLRARSSVRFDGIYVLPANLTEKPDTPAKAMAVLSEFMSPADFEAPRWDRFRYVFQPRSGVPSQQNSPPRA